MSSFRKTLNRKTASSGTVVNGRWSSESYAANGTILASVQPLEMHEMEALPEGRRNHKAYWLFTSTQLNIVGTQNPDIITIDSEDYEVIKQQPWQNGVISHYETLVVEVLED